MFSPEDGSSRLVLNIAIHIPDCIMSQHTILVVNFITENLKPHTHLSKFINNVITHTCDQFVYTVYM